MLFVFKSLKLGESWKSFLTQQTLGCHATYDQSPSEIRMQNSPAILWVQSSFHLFRHYIIQGRRNCGCRGTRSPPLCVQMDFTRTFQTNDKCNNINNVWSHFCKIMVVLEYHRRLWDNIFDTDLYRSITIPKKANTLHQFNVGIYASRNVCVKDIVS